MLGVAATVGVVAGVGMAGITDIIMTIMAMMDTKAAAVGKITTKAAAAITIKAAAVGVTTTDAKQPVEA
jgi:hypothetical protein